MLPLHSEVTFGLLNTELVTVLIFTWVEVSPIDFFFPLGLIWPMLKVCNCMPPFGNDVNIFVDCHVYTVWFCLQLPAFFCLFFSPLLRFNMS